MHIRSAIVTALLALAVGCSPATSPESAAPSSSTPVTPSPSASPSGETTLDVRTEDALATVDEYFAAYDAGDIEGMMALLTPDARVGFAGEDWGLQTWRHLHEWKAAEGTVMLPRDCASTQSDESDSVTVTCEYGQQEYLSQVVDASVVPHTATFVVGPAGITLLDQDFGPPDFLTYGRPFSAWMDAHHPDDADAVGCCGWESVEDARGKGALLAEYADLWAAWLEDHPGCTWRDTACQSDGAS